MTDFFQLPEDIGQKEVIRNGVVVQEASEIPAGQASSTESISVVLPDKGYVLPVIDRYRFPSEVSRDMLGFPRATKPYEFLTRNDAYELTQEDWIYDITGLDERPDLDGTESARWAQLQEAHALYEPEPNGEIRYNPSAQSAQLILNSNEGGFQRARITTKQRYRYQPGRIVRASIACRLSTQATPVSVKRLWGVGDPTDGFFIECSGDGEGDRLQVLYRVSAGNGLKYETRIPRSAWNGDPLDGSGRSQQKLDLSKTFMTLIEWGWYGASNVRFYFFVVDNDDDLPTSITQIPRARWVLAHELVLADTAKRNDLQESNGGGGLRSYDVPSLRSPSLPVWVEISNSGNLARSEFIERYGASVIVDGGNDNKKKITTVDGSFGRLVEPFIGGSASGTGQSVMTLRCRSRIVNNDGKQVENFLVTTPLKLNAIATAPVELEIWRDPVMVPPDGVGHVNGQLPYRPGDYVNPFNVVPLALTSYDSDGALIAITQEEPTNEFLVVDVPYNSSDLYTLDVSYNDYRVVESGKKIGSFLIGESGCSLDLKEVFGGQREQISTEFDSPPEFPHKTSSITVEEFSTRDGRISVASGFPLRLTANQRVSLGSRNYYVLRVLDPETFQLKEARVGTEPVTTGITRGDTLVAHYELDLDANVASRLVPVYSTEIVFVARPLFASYPTADASSEINAEWMTLVNAFSDSAYSAQPSPTIYLHLTNGVS